MKYERFKKEIWRHYRLHKRDLPWRRTKNPYRILVSEIMLQQTQVSRVIPYYEKFLKVFPDFEALAATPTPRLLRTWRGLGYNRRALNLKKLAQIVAEKYGGKLPSDFETLISLPGIGKGTAGAICAFAFEKPVPFLETNIRRVLIHFFFFKFRSSQDRNINHKKHSNILENVGMSSGITDAEILKLVEKTLPGKDVRPVRSRSPRGGRSRASGRAASNGIREWYYALMDYGAMLARNGENLNRRSRSYRTQPRFKGSNRELRGKILRLMLEKKSLCKETAVKLLKETPSRTALALSQLEKEGFIKKRNGRIALVS